MKKDKLHKIILGGSIVVLVISLVPLFFSEWFEINIHTVGIRISVLIVSFAAFISSAFFSYLVYSHNRTVSKLNDDMNKRGEMFREIQFASSNYSIIEFTDRMLIYKESDRYIKRFLEDKEFGFHLIETDTNEKIEEITLDKYSFYTIRIPFKIVEGKMVSKLKVSQIRFERDLKKYYFRPTNERQEETGYILYNETTKRNNLIMNLIVKKDNDFFDQEVNVFTKIKIIINVVSLLGVTTKGINELYFTNPTQKEGDGLHTYKINSSNFTLLERPKIESLDELEFDLL
ncbi:MAG: hypothetical protein GX312_05940 [Candidatus Phytoplasma sp.]|nr:hypothetical protein [Phytoplasma sp.]